MNILLTNDDGIFAPGLAAVYKKLCELGNVTVVAPADSQSGASHSITFKSPLLCNQVEIDGLFTGYSVFGSPADCVKLAAMQLHEEKIDLLVSGINNGANAGINIYYSGTVAAAMEGALMKIPAVAMSLAAEQDMDYDKAADYCMAVLKQLLPIDAGSVININVPLLSQGKPKGVMVAPQSNKGFDEYYIPQKDEKGRTAFQLAGAPHPTDGTANDTSALVDGYISVTALAPDMTDHPKTQKLQQTPLKLGD